MNKNTIYGDTNSFVPGGVRLGTPAMTTRGLMEDDFVQGIPFLLSCVPLPSLSSVRLLINRFFVAVAKFLDRGSKIAVQVQAKHGKLLKDFLQALQDDEDLKVYSPSHLHLHSTSCNTISITQQLKKEVEEFASHFPIPGHKEF